MCTALSHYLEQLGSSMFSSEKNLEGLGQYELTDVSIEVS